MPIDVPLRCSCGEVRGVAHDVSPRTGTRVVCMCIDCQTYAHALGRAAEILNENGGTDIFQLAPGQIELTAGAEQLRCLRLGPKGAMRFHTDCCKTPVGNLSPRPSLPFVGVPHCFMDHGSDPGARERDLGPIRYLVQAQDGHGQLPLGSHPRFPFSVLLRTLRLLVRARLRGLGQPSPFWDEHGRPRAAPVVLSREERARFRDQARNSSTAS